MVHRFASGREYRPTPLTHVTNAPYRRPLDTRRLAELDWANPLTEPELGSDRSLAANRLLANLYESGALFLSNLGLAGPETDFDAFYRSQSRLDADKESAPVEAYVFDFLDSSVRVNGRWDCDALEARFSSAIEEAVRAERPVLRAIESAPEPAAAAELMIVQMALTGLSEATAMSWYSGGAYGLDQSELFKIVIDKLCYRVFESQRGTLFAQLCDSINLNPDPNHYWFFYLPSFLAGNNYFYWVARNRSGFFRYIGAVAYLKATFAPSFAELTKTFRKVYGDRIDSWCRDELALIDQHHGRMVVHDLLLPLAREHGPRATREVVRGMEEVRLLGRLADQELLEQIQWQPTRNQGVPGPDGTTLELIDTSHFSTTVAELDTKVSVLRGSVELHWLPTQAPLVLDAGQHVRVPAGRLYGLRTPKAGSVRVTSSEPR